eukprot:CAMPEP_0114551216 /NCGR_PEP_ID=MMETSP0114-20121206/6485_1 /TAXON_ID=31324 /ORGANISM="Goniomonas sp, Strain m" /LENGTH=228 /DNA_ID=CAMNT_0001736035 /DNA_START=245 /DNA_END=932 /DNA_ORIENTATION=-
MGPLDAEARFAIEGDTSGDVRPPDSRRDAGQTMERRMFSPSEMDTDKSGCVRLWGRGDDGRGDEGRRWTLWASSSGFSLTPSSVGSGEEALAGLGVTGAGRGDDGRAWGDLRRSEDGEVVLGNAAVTSHHHPVGEVARLNYSGVEGALASASLRETCSQLRPSQSGNMSWVADLVCFVTVTKAVDWPSAVNAGPEIVGFSRHHEHRSHQDREAPGGDQHFGADVHEYL